MKKYAGILVLASLIIVVIIPYANSLRNPFMWDEEEIIVSNPMIKDLRYLPLVFKTDIFGRPVKAGGFYRPLYMLSFAADYRMWGLDPFGYHLFSIILHILNALLFYVLMSRIGLQRKTAWLAALLFALFPANSGAVTPIAMRDGLLMVFLSMSCLLLFLKGIKSSAVYFFCSALVFVTAVFTKESSLVLPLLIAAYAFIFLDKDRRRKIFLPLTVLVGIAALYCVSRFLFLGNPFSRTLSLINEASLIERLYTLPRILWTSLRIIVAPFVLQSEYHFVVHSFKDAYVWGGAPLLVLFSVLIARRSKPALFFLLWFFIGLLPYSNILLPLHATMTGHWVYFSSMAVAALIAMGVFALVDVMGPGRTLRRVAVLTFIFIAVLCALKIRDRNREWSDPFVLYQKDAEREPDSFLLHCNLGVEYFRKGMLEDAKRELERSNNACPGRGYDVAYNNLGVISAREGDISRAISYYKSSILLNDYALAYENLGSLYNELGMREEALSVLKRGAALYPMDIRIRNILHDIV
ncbi:MAG: tetratricopeptide repeat protein, partial [Candidatus Omnitrophica bacterium]|nr:tetratricopeptide repeat protein [Candidatus Omnitrophota bacterium]